MSPHKIVARDVKEKNIYCKFDLNLSRFGVINGCGLGIGSLSILALLNEELQMNDSFKTTIHSPFNIAFGATQRHEIDNINK